MSTDATATADAPAAHAATTPGGAWLFPGQGSQQVGMARDLYDADPAVRDLVAEASDRAGIDVARLCFAGPAEELQRTEHAQPCLLTASTACARALAAHGLAPAFVAGHSLGEYSALVQAGVLAFGDAVYAVRRRGLLMAAAQGGAMAAILGLDDATVERLCAEHGDVVAANYNAPGQVVISGAAAAVAAASEAARAAGARKVVALNVSGAFHSPLMREAAAELAGVLGSLPFHDARVPVVCNVDGASHRAATEFPPLLVRQAAEPVRWTAIIRRLTEEGVDRFIEVGPGRVLTGLLRSIDRSLAGGQAGSVEAIKRLAAG